MSKAYPLPLPCVKRSDCRIPGSSQARMLDQLIALCLSGQSCFACPADLQLLVDADHDPDFLPMVKQADLLIPADKAEAPVKLMNNHEGVAQEILDAQWFYEALVYRGSEELLNRSCARLYREHPGLRVAGAYSTSRERK